MYWFYVRSLGYTCEESDGKKVTRYPFASVMTPLEPRSSVSPPTKITAARAACNKAFAIVCRYSGGRDLVEEMVAANYWPLAKVKPSFCLEDVQDPIFGGVEGVPYPRFGLQKPADKSAEDVVLDVEMRAREILGEISDKEYLA